jgi:type 1 fimbriae regulatory protein FimE
VQKDFFNSIGQNATLPSKALCLLSSKADEQSVMRLTTRAGEAAGFSFLYPQLCCDTAGGYKLANDGQDARAIQHYLGHRSIASTVRDTALAPDRFKGFWKD